METSDLVREPEDKNWMNEISILCKWHLDNAVENHTRQYLWRRQRNKNKWGWFYYEIGAILHGAMKSYFSEKICLLWLAAHSLASRTHFRTRFPDSAGNSMQSSITELDGTSGSEVCCRLQFSARLLGPAIGWQSGFQGNPGHPAGTGRLLVFI